MSRVSIAHFIRLGASVVIACCAAACGGDKNTTGSDDNPLVVYGGERLAWDQKADSVQQLHAMKFVLYVDGVRSTLGSPTCSDVPTGGGFSCSGVLPQMSLGKHVLTLTSVLGDHESPPSTTMTVMKATRASAAQSSASFAAATQWPVCTPEPPTECYEAKALAAGLAEVTALSPVPDGRLFFVEGGNRIRIIARDVLLAEPAFRVEGQISQIVGMALDDDFGSTRAVFVASTEQSFHGPLLNITRYRELQGTLAEGATIVSGLSFHAGANAPIAISNGSIFLAIPAAEDGRVIRDFGAESGAVLRFERDGRVPRDNPRASPVVAKGFERPTAVAVERLSGRVWLTGQDASGTEGIMSFSIGDRTTWPILPSPVSPDTTSVVKDSQRPAPSARLYLAANGVLRRLVLRSNGLPSSLTDVRFGGTVIVTDASTAPNGDGYAALMADGDGPVSIVRIMPQ